MRSTSLLLVLAFFATNSFADIPPHPARRPVVVPETTPSVVAPAEPSLPVGTKPVATPVPERLVKRSDVPFEKGKTAVGEISDITTKKPLGLGIEGIADDSTMAKLGFKNHDVLVSVNGHPMVKVSDFELLSQSLPVSKFHEYEVRRGDEKMKWRVVFLDGKDESTAPKVDPYAKLSPERVVKLKKDLVKSLDAEPTGTRLNPELKKGTQSTRCMRVVSLTAKSAFKRAGLIPGDCLLAIDGKLFDTTTAVVALFDQMRLHEAPITLVLERRGETKMIKVEFE